jgi:hypothetical protein
VDGVKFTGLLLPYKRAENAIVRVCVVMPSLRSVELVLGLILTASHCYYVEAVGLRSASSTERRAGNFSLFRLLVGISARHEDVDSFTAASCYVHVIKWLETHQWQNRCDIIKFIYY